ncbi:MAG: LysR family transcriptional regulator [Gammaproteobacteria bacterium]|nr:LysR family transcriptional regulator [Gammaproteobacteria bacterium]
MRRFPALAALRAFEASARLGSHRKAAAELGVDPTVVGKHIRALEAELGVALMHASPTGTALTPAGRRYFERIARALEAIVAATEEARARLPERTLHVACSPGFAVRWLTPHISDFLQAHPGIEITIRPTDRAPDLNLGEADVDIRYAEHGPPGLSCIELCRPRVFPVANPATFGFPLEGITTLADLLQAPLLHEETFAHWQLWLRRAGLEVSELPHGARYWNAAMAVDAAKRGHGIALALDVLVADELASGVLIELLQTAVRLYPYLVCVRPDRLAEPIIGDFLGWLLPQFGRAGA